MQNKADDDKMMMALVLLSSADVPPHEALFSAVSRRIPQASEPGPKVNADDALLVIVDGLVCTILRIAAAAPISSEDSVFKTSWYWSQAWDSVKNHQSHMVLSVSGGEAHQRGLLLQQLMASAVEASQASLAVLCESSDTIWPASMISQIIQPDTRVIAAPVFVSARFGREPLADGKTDSTYAVTKGLTAFGFMEIETYGFQGKLTDLNETLMGVASYLLEGGSAVNDGDTVGPDEATKIIVHYQPSRDKSGRQVYALHFE